MTYSNQELMAIYKMAKAMALADGHVDLNEMGFIAEEMRFLGVSDKHVFFEADKMQEDVAFSILRNMSPEKKRYVCGCLAAISVVDQHVDAKEIAVWQFVSTVAQFPNVTFQAALEFWRDHR